MMLMQRTIVNGTLVGVLLITPIWLTGCGERIESADRSVTARQDESEFVLAVVLDLSGSFTHQMADQGKAYEFSLAVLDRYFRHRNGMNDRLILAQISGTQRSLLWEGSPLQLRQDFPSADAFRQFLLDKADPNGSLVNEGVANAVDYVARNPRIASGKAKSAVFVLSDMFDTSPDPAAAEQRLMQSLGDYSRAGGAVGLYYVDQSQVTNWQQKLHNAGFQDYCVECEIVGRPSLPGLDL